MILFAIALLAGPAAPPAPYGLIGSMKAKPGQREAVIALLRSGTANMPGNRGYWVAKDASDPDVIWITEAWDSKASHDASLALPAVRATITKARPLIAGMGESHETVPVF